jgi:uncharacterized membrane protein
MRTGVNDPTTAVHVIETEEDLFCNLTNEMLGDALALVTLDEAEQVFSEDFENHAYMGSMGTFMSKVI